MRFPATIAVSAMVGFLALSYEVLWYRGLSIISSGSPAAFGLLLLFYLSGIALAARRVEHASNPDRLAPILVKCIFFANLISFGLLPMMGQLGTITGSITILPLVMIAAGLMGAAFPLLAAIAIDPATNTGQRVAFVYVANITGSVLGSFLTGYVLLDFLSLQYTSFLLVVLGLITTGVAQFATHTGSLKRTVATLLATGVILTGSLFVIFEGLYEKLIFRTTYDGEVRFAEVIENRSGVISLTDDGRVFGGGAYDGAFNTSATHDINMIRRAYMMIGLRPEMQSVLVVGLGSGSWAQVFAHAPHVQNVTVVEINPGYVDLLDRSPVVESLRRNPKVEFVIDDGRQWMLRNPERRFDMIVTNTTWHFRAHSSGLLSREFLALVKEHLTPGGAYLFNSTGSLDALKTGAEAFPQGLRIHSSLALSDSPLTFDQDQIREVMENFRIDGNAVFDPASEDDQNTIESMVELGNAIDTNDQVYSFSLETRDHILARTTGATIITDDNMFCEWQNPFVNLAPPPLRLAPLSEL